MAKEKCPIINCESNVCGFEEYLCKKHPECQIEVKCLTHDYILAEWDNNREL